MDKQVINNEERRKKIIEYISMHQGCNKEKAWKGVETFMARVTFYNLLRELEEEAVVYRGEKEKPKSRDNKLFVNTGNLLVTVPKELENFENAFFILMNKAKSASEVTSDFDTTYSLLSLPLFIFYEVVNVYHLLAIVTWPLLVLEKETLKKLYTLVFTKLSEMQLRIYQSLNTSRFVNVNLMLQSTIARRYLYSSDKWLKSHDMFSNIGLQKEIESVLDTLWDIKRDYLKDAHPEPHIFRWDYKYDDGWRKLLKLMKQHPEQTYGRYLNEIYGDTSSELNKK